VLDGEQRELLLGVVAGVSPGREHGRDQLLGAGQRERGVVEEAGLQVLPAGGVVLPVRGVDRAQRECVVFFLAPPQFAVHVARAALVLGHGLQLGPEGRAQLALGAAVPRGGGRDQYNHDDDDRDEDGHDALLR
jgi:hypothetical protein